MIVDNKYIGNVIGKKGANVQEVKPQQMLSQNSQAQ